MMLMINLHQFHLLEPTIDNKSGPDPPKRVTPIGTLSLSVPLKIVSTPSEFAEFLIAQQL